MRPKKTADIQIKRITRGSSNYLERKVSNPGILGTAIACLPKFVLLLSRSILSPLMPLTISVLSNSQSPALYPHSFRIFSEVRHSPWLEGCLMFFFLNKSYRSSAWSLKILLFVRTGERLYFSSSGVCTPVAYQV